MPIVNGYTIEDGANLRGAKLARANLRGMNLEEANLERANLERANLGNAILERANLRGANLRGAYLRDTNLEGANLEGANLSGANLELANLSGANLSGANLENAILEEANLRGANLAGANLAGANLSGADLIDSDLSGSHLAGANLERANLAGANLEDSDLEEMNLEGADLDRANLEGANLIRVNLRGANLEGVNLDGANLENAILENANLGLATLEGANLSGANLSGANLSESEFSGANLSGANLSGANLSETDFSGANLSGANFTNVIFDDNTILTGADFVNVINLNVNNLTPQQRNDVAGIAQPIINEVLPAGRAYEIHNLFTSLDMDEIMGFINDFNKKHDFNPKTMPSGVSLENDLFTKLILFITNSELFPDNEKIENINKLNRILTKIKTYERYQSNKSLLNSMVEFVSKQNDDFIEQYIQILKDECLNAYGRDEESCVKGMFERVVTTIGKASETLTKAEKYENDPIYKILNKLFRIIDFNALAQEWGAIYLEDGPKEAELKALSTVEERKQHFINFIRELIRNKYEVNPDKVMTKINTTANEFEEMGVFERMTFGGKKSRRTKNTKKIRKIKRSLKTKTKMKRNNKKTKMKMKRNNKKTKMKKHI